MRRIFLYLNLTFFSALSFAQTESILIDFGGSSVGMPWNNIQNPTAGSVTNAINNFGFQTFVDIQVIDDFRGTNSSGSQVSNTSINMPSEVSGDSFFGNMFNFNGEVQETAAIEISDLDPNTEYTLEIFASRLASDNRETRYVLEGVTSDTLFLNPSDNTSSTVVFTAYPDGNGNFTLSLTAGPNNVNTYGFYYLGAMKMTYISDTIYPEELSVLSPNGGEYWQVGRTVDIDLKNSVNDEVVLSYSTDAGNLWSTIDTLGMYVSTYSWTVPNSVSQNCLVRAQQLNGSEQDESDNIFEIAGTNDTCRIVVIGSSTAAGSGASSIDSAWVGRYKHDLYRRDTRYDIINLAVGGYNTFKLLPTGTPIPSGVNQSIDINKNISAALALNPSAVIVNLPSNDAANNFGVDTQMHNFGLMDSVANLAGVDFYVCTTQPRNFSDPAKIQIQLETRDSILTEYGNKAIDVWTGLADSNSFILPQYNSGDGVHLNNFGHQLIYQRVMNVGVDEVCAIDYVAVENIQTEEINVSVYPNPFNSYVYVEFEETDIDRFEVVVQDVLGRRLIDQNHFFTEQQLKKKIDISPEHSGTYIMVIKGYKKTGDVVYKQFILVK